MIRMAIPALTVAWLALAAPQAVSQDRRLDLGQLPPMAIGLADEVLEVDLARSESSVVLFAAPLAAEDATTGIGVALVGPSRAASLTRNRPGRPARFDFAAIPSVFVSGLEPSVEATVTPEAMGGAGLDPALLAIPRRGDLAGPIVDTWRQQMVTLQANRGSYVLNGVTVDRMEGGLRRVRLTLPPNSPPGEYRLRAVVFQDGQAVARTDKVLTLARSGADATLFTLATRHGLIYGFVAILMAAVVGGIASYIGRR